MIRILRLVILIGVIAGLFASKATYAQGLQTVTIGKISSEKSCSLYEMSAGRSTTIATPRVLATASEWRTWLVRDCIDNFASLRTSLEAALAASGKFIVKPSGGAYTVSARISDVSGGDGGEPAIPPVGDGGFSVSSSRMFVNMDVTVKDAAGRTIHGGLFTKSLETGAAAEVGDFRTSSSRSGQALYGQLQHEVALAAARSVAFRLAPMRVVGGGGRQIRLNYGAPLLSLGAVVAVTSPDGASTARYLVSVAGQGSATADADGDGAFAAIAPGATAVLIEPDDPAANGRRLRRVDLP